MNFQGSVEMGYNMLKPCSNSHRCKCAENCLYHGCYLAEEKNKMNAKNMKMNTKKEKITCGLELTRNFKRE